VLSAFDLTGLIDNINNRYHILEINNNRVHPYHTTYMDTPDYLFYNQHMRGELERHKIRIRKYEHTGESFLEIKKKTNKSRTVKTRIENNDSSSNFSKEAIEFISKNSPVNPQDINPVLEIMFTRATLIGLDSKERITLDYNISFTETINGGHIEMPYLAIIELKREGFTHASPFNILLKQYGIYPSGFSKYCMGSAILNESLRKNIFKQNLIFLDKIKNGYNGTLNS